MNLPIRRGRRAERRARRHLRRSGLQILARNLRARSGEIDILAREGRVLAVVEVRQRAGGLLAADLSVTPEKLRKVAAAWRDLARKLQLPRDHPVRFDLVLLGPEGDPVHQRGISLPESAPG